MADGFVSIVGAGPGDPGLLTRKAARRLAEAQVVVHDRLVSRQILALAHPDARLVYVGKMPDRHAVPQDGINRILVDEARKGLRVVRLKGGDPFVFGRGGEEAEELVQAGIRFEIVPGISSSIAVPAYAGIPVTHRDLCTSFQVITGHERPGKESSGLDWPVLAASPGTLVFLMGVANLAEISSRLIDNGKPAHTPVAVIERGTTTAQRTVKGNLSDIASRVLESGLGSPAVTVIGEVVKLADRLTWFGGGRLAGRRIIVTRSREQASELSRLIEDEGGEALEFPVIRTVPPADWSAVDQAVDRPEGWDWIVFTSANGVKAFFKRLTEREIDIRRLGAARLCAVGEATARELEQRGLFAELVPPVYTTAVLLDTLLSRLAPGDSVLLARADLADRRLSEGLVAAGFECRDLVVYHTQAAGGDGAELREVLERGGADGITFTSSSTVTNFLDLVGRENLALIKDCKLYSIGPVTSETAREAGLHIHAEAAPHTIAALAAIIE